MGVFATCLEARSYRDAVLPGVETAQVRRRDTGVQQRMDSIIPELMQARDDAARDLQQATADELAAIARRLAEFVSLKVIAKGLEHVARNRFAFGLTKPDSKALELLSDRATDLSAQLAHAGFHHEVEPLDLALLNADLFTKVYTTVTPIVSIARLGNIVAPPLMEFEPVRQAASGQFAAFEASITRLLSNSPTELLGEVNRTRQQIDAQCP